MRIAVNARFLLSGKMEGVGWYSYEVLKRMVLNHPEDEFIFIFDRPYDDRFLFSNNVKPIVIGPPARHPVLWYIWFEWSLSKLLDKLKPDVFFSPDGYSSLRSTVPTLMTVHDIAYYHYPKQVSWLVWKYYHHFTPKYLRHVSKITTVSEFVKADIVKHLNIQASKIEVAHNGWRSEFKPATKEIKENIQDKFSNGKAYFLYYGAIHPRKNIVNLIDAFELYKAETGSNFCLLLVGRMAWHTTEVTDKLQNSKYKKDIIHIGYVENDLYNIVASAEAVVYVSYFEGFGLPVIEAMASGVPVITSNVSSLPEVAGDAALIVDPYNVSKIAKEMKSITEDLDLKNQLVTKGLKRATEFNWDQTATKIYSILRQLTSG